MSGANPPDNPDTRRKVYAAYRAYFDLAERKRRWNVREDIPWDQCNPGVDPVVAIIDDESQLTNIGWDDLLAERALVIIEWPERAGNRMPEGHLHIDIEYVDGDAGRRVLLAG